MTPRRTLATALGVLVVLSLVAVDPAALALLLDAELLSLLGSAGVMLTLEQSRTWTRHLVTRIRCAPSAVTFAAGVGMTREDPRSILAC